MKTLIVSFPFITNALGWITEHHETFSSTSYIASTLSGFAIAIYYFTKTLKEKNK